MFQSLFVLTVLLFGFLAFAGTLRVLQAYVVEIIQRRLFVRVLTDLAHRLPRVRLEVYDSNHGAELVNRFFDVLTVQKVSATILLEGVAVVLQTIVGLLVLAFYHPFLLAFDLTLLGAIGFIVFALGRGAEGTAINESKAKYSAAAWLEEIARNPLLFKFNGGSELALARANERAHEYLEARKTHYQVILRQTIAAVAVQAVAATALLALGGELVMQGQLTLGQLVAAELIVSIVLASLAKFGKQFEVFYDLLAAVDKLGYLLDLPLERETGREQPLGARPASLRIQGLDFGYTPNNIVLNGFHLEIASGERVAILGGHGSGKSTLVDLICGLRLPTGGRIAVDQIDLREYNLASLRDHIAIVKDIELVEDTIVENVRNGRETLGVHSIRQSVEDVGLLQEILGLPDGLDTFLGPTGAPLSHGQLRRLVLARAIVGGPRLLVLDGTLDDLDPESREPVCATILKRDKPWTLVLLTRDRACAERCERIVTLDQQVEANKYTRLDEHGGVPGISDKQEA
jgi:ABC-type bacteriocin/lantibiotic exporter with double-glycine peptidase domain